MIKLTRTTEPPTAFAGEQRIEKNLALIGLRRSGGKPDSGVWRRAKAHLKAETHGKCAYCESSTIRAAEDDLGLNREELRRRRWHSYQTLRTLADLIEKVPAEYASARARAITQIETMMASDQEYAAMARYFVLIEWRLDVNPPERRAE